MNMTEQLSQPDTPFEIATKVVSSPEGDYSFVVPAEPKTSFANEDERKRYRQEERNIILHNWEAISKPTEGDEVDTAYLEDSVNSALSVLDANVMDSDFGQAMEKTFNRKIDARWAKEWLGKVESGDEETEELQTSNSRWSKVMSLASQKIGGKSTEGYSMAISIVTTKGKLGDHIAAENKVADLYVDYLENLSPEDARNIKFRHILPKIAEQKGTSIEELLEGLKNEAAQEQEDVEQQVGELNADDISNIELYWEEMKAKIQGLGKDAVVAYNEARQKVTENFNKIKQPASTVVNGVVDKAKSIRIRRPSDKTLVNVERVAKTALLGVGVAGAIQAGSILTRQARTETASRPAGLPENVTETEGYSGQDLNSYIQEAERQDVDAQVQVASGNDVDGGEDALPAEESQPAEVSEVPQAEASSVESVQETREYSGVISQLNERGYRVEQGEDGIVRWWPKPWTPEGGEGTLDSLLRVGLGYPPGALYPDPDSESEEESILNKFESRRPNAGQEVEIPLDVILESPLYQGAGEAEEAA